MTRMNIATQLGALARSPWALDAGVYTVLRDWYMQRAMSAADQVTAGLPADLAAVAGGKPAMAQGDAYTVTPGGVGLITVSGILMPKGTGMMNMCSPGAASSAALLREQLLQAAADKSVQSALVYIDSPGGNILGVAEAAQALAELAAVKPTVSYSDGQMCSALYWIGSAAPKTYISGPMVQVGSIGVRMDVVDTTAADAKQGISRKTLTFGKYKARGGTGGGGDVAAYDAHAQDQIDYLGSLFADAVAAQRGIDIERVLAELATGQVFIGRQAVDAGLADGVMSLEALISALETNPASVTRVPGARRGASTKGNPQPQPQQQQQQKGKTAMNPEQIKAEHPEAYNAILNTGHVAGHAEGLQAGAAAERDRIQAVRAQALPGHEALIDQLAFDGKTTGPEAAVAVLGAERAKLGTRRDQHYADGIKPVPRSAGSADVDAKVAADGKAKPPKKIDVRASFAGL